MLIRLQVYSLLILASACATPPVGEAEAIGDVIRGMGYRELMRPTDFWTPGAIIAVESDMPFNGRVVCKTESALGADFSPQVSDTLSSSWQRATDRGLKLSAEATAAINAKIGYQAVRDITVKLSNARVYETTDEALIEAAHSGKTTNSCKEAIVRRFNLGHPMTMIAAALEADVVYKLEFEQGIEADLQYSHAQKIAAGFEGRAKAEGKDTVVGKRLLFGITEDRQLLTTFAELVPGLPQLALSGKLDPGARQLLPLDLVLNPLEGSDDEGK
jgi:hypothetical protein